MESCVSGYLHKKFKKQSCIDYKPIASDKENTEQCSNTIEEKSLNESRNESLKDNQKPVELVQGNINDRVSENSTNESSIVNFSYNNSLSSISVKPITTQSANPCISSLETHNQSLNPSIGAGIRPYSPESIVSTVSVSSIPICTYSKETYSPKREDISYINTNSRISSNEEIVVPLVDLKSQEPPLKNKENNSKFEETPVSQDRPSGGKYVCTYCNLGCSKPSVLQKHIRAHTNERPYPCISCGFSFKTRSNLYKHCRSRTHANRVMGNKVQDINNEVIGEKPYDHNKYPSDQPKADNQIEEMAQDLKTKPYKPRFHNAKHMINVVVANERQEYEDPNMNELKDTNSLSHHINEIISKNNSIVNANSQYGPRNYLESQEDLEYSHERRSDEPLNLTNKNRKRCVSEVQEPSTQKSLIKELLLKNLGADTMQCRYCKMIFQTVTELELHKLRSCKGFTKPGLKYTRSSSVNVASILTQNKNAFDNIPQFQNRVFPLKSPGPFLGNTRLVEGEKTRSISYEDVNPPDTMSSASSPGHTSDRYFWSSLDLPADREKKPPVKLFGGEVKITNTSGESESFKIENKIPDGFNSDSRFIEYNNKLNKNHLVKSGLQSGGTVLTNKTHYSKTDSLASNSEVILYKTSSASLPESTSVIAPRISFTEEPYVGHLPELTANVSVESSKTFESSIYGPNIVDFSQKAMKNLTPNIRRPSLTIFASKPSYEEPSHANDKHNGDLLFESKQIKHSSSYDPMHLVVNGKVIPYVPGIPGPIATEEPIERNMGCNIIAVGRPSEDKYPPEPINISPQNFITKERCRDYPILTQPPRKSESVENKMDIAPKTTENHLSTPEKSEARPLNIKTQPTKFARPNSLALKPSSVSLKRHHGLTPTMFNQILISPDTPRIEKKYVQQYLNGNYFSYLGLKSSTKPFYCTLNKTQPFYTHHFSTLSMYSEWRQQDNKIDRLFVSAYDSRQKQQKFTVAGKSSEDLIINSSEFVLTEMPYTSPGKPSSEESKSNVDIVGGHESQEEYTYVRGRVSDEPTRQQEHEAAYGLLTLSKKTTASISTSPVNMSNSFVSLETSKQKSCPSEMIVHIMDTEEIAHVEKINYAKNKILDYENKCAPLFRKSVYEDKVKFLLEKFDTSSSLKPSSSRPLTYPYVPNGFCDEKAKHLTETYADVIKNIHILRETQACLNHYQLSLVDKVRTHSDDNFFRECREVPYHEENGIRLVAPQKTYAEDLHSNPVMVFKDSDGRNKRKLEYEERLKSKIQKNDDVMDLSMGSMGSSNTNFVNSIKTTLDEKEERLHKENTIHVAETRSDYSSRQNVGDDVSKLAGYHRKDKSNVDVLYSVQEKPVEPVQEIVPERPNILHYDNSAMETLAEVATKQDKLEKNTLAKSVASEYLKLATMNDYPQDVNIVSKDVNELIVKPEGSKSCSICSKNFIKSSQLRLHMNIHYLERPFRCDSCSVSFRTRGHLQKHERSASHHNKLTSSPAQNSSEPRPFKCLDCSIAFRIHGHLAKHLRSKMHIMKLECLAKIPFGLYAELERSNSLLTEINTVDGDQCLESLRILAKKVFSNDPNKLNQLESSEVVERNS